MEKGYGVLSLIGFLVADLVIGVFVILLIVKLFSVLFVKSRGMQFLKNDNTSTTIVLVAVLISMGLLCSGTFITTQQNLHLAVKIPAEEQTPYVLQTVLLGITQIIFSVMVTLFLAFVATKLFDLMTKEIKEYEMIQKNNVSVGLLLGGIIIALTLLIKFPFTLLVERLIPLPIYTFAY